MSENKNKPADKRQPPPPPENKPTTADDPGEAPQTKMIKSEKE